MRTRSARCGCASLAEEDVVVASKQDAAVAHLRGLLVAVEELLLEVEHRLLAISTPDDDGPLLGTLLVHADRELAVRAILADFVRPTLADDVVARLGGSIGYGDVVPRMGLRSVASVVIALGRDVIGVDSCGKRLGGHPSE